MTNPDSRVDTLLLQLLDAVQEDSLYLGGKIAEAALLGKTDEAHSIVDEIGKLRAFSEQVNSLVKVWDIASKIPVSQFPQVEKVLERIEEKEQASTPDTFSVQTEDHSGNGADHSSDRRPAARTIGAKFTEYGPLITDLLLRHDGYMSLSQIKRSLPQYPKGNAWTTIYNGLKQKGLVSGGAGNWTLTQKGREFVKGQRRNKNL